MWNKDYNYREEYLCEKKKAMPLLLTPLMSGKINIKDRVIRARRIIHSEYADIDERDKEKMQAILYTFACKFLGNEELEQVKGEFSMTKLGVMIWNDGEKKGMLKGAVHKLIFQVRRKMEKGYTVEAVAELLEEDMQFVEEIYRTIVLNKSCSDEEIYRQLKKS